MTDATFHVSVKGPDLSFECEVPKEVADRVALLVFSTRAGTSESVSAPYAPLVRRTPTDDSDAAPETDNAGLLDTDLTAAEFVVEAGAKTYPEKITAVAYFHRKFRGVSTFTKEQIAAFLKQAGAGAPKNLTRDLGTTLDRRWIVPDEKQPGSYHLTKTGTTAVDQAFGNDGARKPAETVRKSLRRRRGNGKRPSSTPSSEPVLPVPASDDAE